MNYLLIPQIRVQSANAHTCGFLLGGPPVLPSVFFAHALSRKLGCSVTGVALIHHQAVPLGQSFGVYSPQQRRAAAFTFTNKPARDYSSKNAHALSSQPVACAHLRISLILEVEGLRTIEGVQSFMFGGRLSGGQITAHGAPSFCDTIGEAVEKEQTGFCVIDRRDLMERRDGKNQAMLLVENLGRQSSRDAGDAWLSAACLGYAPVTPFEQREGVREGYDHAFAEPLVGLVQYQSMRSIADVQRVIWRPEWLSNGVFRVVQST